MCNAAAAAKTCNPSATASSCRKGRHFSSTPETQRTCNEVWTKPRLAEWEKWLKHAAADVIRVQEAAQLVADGVEEIGMKWIEVDKNEIVRVETKQVCGVERVPTKLKSRVKDERSATVRQPRPKEYISCSVSRVLERRRCSAETWRARSSRARACPTSCCSGSHEPLPGLNPSDPLLARAPVYGTQDAGRGFWQKFRRTLIGGGVRENRVLQAAYTLTVDGKVLGIIAMHVDDLLYAFDGPVGQGVLSRNLEIIRVQLIFLWQGSAPGRRGRRRFRARCVRGNHLEIQ